LQGSVDVLVKIEHREHEDASVGRCLADDPAGGLDPIETGHADIHQHDVGAQATRLRDRFLSIAGLADNVDVGLALEDQAEAASHQRLIVDDKDTQGATNVVGSSFRVAGIRRTWHEMLYELEGALSGSVARTR
jgi:hypothetical protein